MPIITVTDLYRRIYEEIVDEITRDDNEKAVKAIDGAIDEAKMYLSKFDLVALFGKDVAPVIAATVQSTFLENICLDIAVWQLIKLGCPNINYDSAKSDYEMARSKLKDIQGGKAQPDGWPYKDTTGLTAAPGNSIYSSSNKKRNQFF